MRLKTRLMVIAALALLTGTVRGAEPAEDCARLLTGASTPEKGSAETGAAEAAIVEAWFDALHQDRAWGTAALDAWFAEVLAAEDRESGRSAPDGLLSSEVVSALGEIEVLIEGLTAAGTINPVVLGEKIRSRIRDHQSASLRGAEVAMGRAEALAPVRSVAVGGEVLLAPLVLRNGNRVVVGATGIVVFLDRSGNVLARHALQRTVVTSPVELGSGKVLLPTEFGLAAVFSSDGRHLVDRMLPSPVDADPVLVLPDGRAFAFGHRGNWTLISLEGEAALQENSNDSFAAPPRMLRDGRIAVGSTSGILHFFSAAPGQVASTASGQGLESLPPRDLGARVELPVAELSDGSLVVCEAFGRVHFLNSDGTRKTGADGRPVRLELGTRIQFGPLVLPDGNVAVVTGKGGVFFVRPDGTIAASGKTEKPAGLAPRVDAEGALWLATQHPESSAKEAGALARVSSNGDVAWVWSSESARVTAGASLLPEGGVAFGTSSGELHFLTTQGAPLGVLQMNAPVLLSPVAAFEGALAAGGANGELWLIDPRVAKGGFSF